MTLRSDDDLEGDPEGEHGANATISGDEGTPLLPQPTDPVEALRAKYRQRVLILSFALVLLLQLGGATVGPPMTAVLEDIICHERHPEVANGVRNGVLSNDPMCKAPDVQGELAMLLGWTATVDCLPSILLAVPYGLLSDRWGRRPVLSLAIFGFVLRIIFLYVVFFFSNVISVWTSLLSSLCLLVGGGTPVIQAMFYTCLTDVIPMAQRANVFLGVSAASLVSEMIAGPLAGVLMLYTPWLALFAAFGMIVLSNLIALALPETLEVHRLHDRVAHQHRAESTTSSGQDQDDEVVDDDEGGDTVVAGAKRTPVQRAWHKALASVREVWDFVLGNRHVAPLVPALVLVILGRLAQDFMLQYATKRYGWSWAKASFLLSIRSVANLVVLLGVLPALSWFAMTRLRMSGVAKDLWLARGGAVALVAGALLIAFATNGGFLSVGLVVFAGGSGEVALLRSLANALVEEHHVGILNTLLGFGETVGAMVAAPALAESLRAGLHLGGLWIGLPFMVAAVLFAIPAVVLFLFRLPDVRQADAGSDGTRECEPEASAA